MHPQPAFPAPQLDPGEEALLRDTFAAHALASVDTDRGWAAIAGQISAANTTSATTSATAQNTHLAVAAPSGARARPAWRRHAHLPRALTRIAAAVAVAAVLMGTGYGTFRYLTTKGNAIARNNLYTAVNQHQTDQGVTFEVDRAYADTGSTSILYSVDLSSALAARGYTSATPMTFDLTDQYGDQGGSGYTICHPGSGSAVETCEISDNAFAVPAGVTQLTITYDIYRVLLARGGNHPLQEMIQGAWNFQFTIPFHQKSVGPGGPYGLPTPPAGRVPGVWRGV